jgi:hypothetical protein
METYEYKIDLGRLSGVDGSSQFHFVSDDPHITKQNIVDSMVVETPRLEYRVVVRNHDIDEEFTLYADRLLTKEEIVDSMVVLKRKRPQNQTRTDDSSVDFLKSMFGFK